MDQMKQELEQYKEELKNLKNSSARYCFEHEINPEDIKKENIKVEEQVKTEPICIIDIEDEV